MLTNNPNKLIVHHSASQLEGEQLTQINEWHKERDFYLSSLGFFVGYHYVISQAGVVTQTRLITDEGCHTIGQNTQSIGICLEGDFDVQQVTPPQEKALAQLCVKLCAAYKIPYTEIFPHRHFKQTDCYGSNLSDNYAQIVCIREKIDTLQTELVVTEGACLAK